MRVGCSARDAAQHAHPPRWCGQHSLSRFLACVCSGMVARQVVCGTHIGARRSRAAVAAAEQQLSLVKVTACDGHHHAGWGRKRLGLSNRSTNAVGGLVHQKTTPVVPHCTALPGPIRRHLKSEQQRRDSSLSLRKATSLTTVHGKCVRQVLLGALGALCSRRRCCAQPSPSAPAMQRARPTRWRSRMARWRSRT